MDLTSTLSQEDKATTLWQEWPGGAVPKQCTYTLTAWISKQPGRANAVTVILMVFTDGETEAVGPTLGMQLEMDPGPCSVSNQAFGAWHWPHSGPTVAPTVAPVATSVRCSPPPLSTLQVELTSSRWMQSFARR